MKFLLLSFLSIVALVASQDGPAMCYMEHSANGRDASQCAGGNFFWSYNAGANSCVKFYYFGCWGNENRFLTQAQCELLCKKTEEKDNESNKANEEVSKSNEEVSKPNEEIGEPNEELEADPE
uniref:BPTI/Kunitz inhibitor domain-containing protein n=1 Tax=Glossina morsitans morsitans TaxID=37546 RepID=A0A1B0FF55_GLOMM